MPHDKNGAKLKSGDRVLIPAKILTLSEAATCNVTAQLDKPEGGDGYAPTLTCHTSQLMKDDGDEHDKPPE